MDNDTKLHDLLLFGTSLQGAERTEAINNLAKLLKISSEQVEIMLEKNSVVLRRRVSTEIANKYVQKLSALGFQCNTRPSKEKSIGLELVPKENIVHSLTCPACGYVHTFEEEDDKPEVCESCNIVFAKYSQNLKLEREKIKRAMLAKSEREEKALQEENQRCQEEERRRQLEEEIRRELGLPRMLTRRSTLISSATGIFALGLVLGIGGIMTYNSLNSLQDDPEHLSAQLNENSLEYNELQDIGGVPSGSLPGLGNAQAGNAVQAGLQAQVLPNLPAETVASMDPGMVTHLQVTEMLDVQPDNADDVIPDVSTGTVSNQLAGSEHGNNWSSSMLTADSLGVVGGNPEVALTEIAAIIPSVNEDQSADTFSEVPESELIPKMLDDLGNDLEWHEFILHQAFELTAAGQTGTALTLMGLIDNPRMLMEGGAKMAVWLAQKDRVSEADQVFEHLKTLTETLPGGSRMKVEALHNIARGQAAIPSKALDAEFTAMKARVIAESATGACDQASISAEAAAMLSALGRDKAARQAYQQSHQGLSRIEGKMELLTCLGHLVRSYARAGNRGGALILLQDMAKGGEALESRDERDTVIQLASRLYRELGDMQTAQALAATITDLQVRNNTMYINVIEVLSTGGIGTAMTSLETIQSPFFKARAFGMLALSQAGEEKYRKLAAESFKQAHELTASLSNPMEKLVVSAELARFATRAGHHAEADADFTHAIKLLNQLPTTIDRDPLLAILATNQARALRLGDAHQQQSNIQDSKLARTTSENLSDSEELMHKIN